MTITIRKPKRYIITGAILAGFFITLDAFTSNALQTPSTGSQIVTQASTSVKEFFEALRVIGGLLGMVMTGIGVWVYYKAMQKTQTTTAMQNTIDVQHGELVALRERSDRLHTDLTSILDSNKIKDAELAVLRAKTDLTAIITEQRKFNEILVQGFSTIGERSERLTSESVGAITKHLDYISTNSRTILETSKINQELIKTLCGGNDAK